MEQNGHQVLNAEEGYARCTAWGRGFNLHKLHGEDASREVYMLSTS